MIAQLLATDAARVKLGARDISTAEAEQLPRNRHATARNPGGGGQEGERLLLIGQTDRERKIPRLRGQRTRGETPILSPARSSPSSCAARDQRFPGPAHVASPAKGSQARVGREATGMQSALSVDFPRSDGKSWRQMSDSPHKTVHFRCFLLCIGVSLFFGIQAGQRNWSPGR